MANEQVNCPYYTRTGSCRQKGITCHYDHRDPVQSRTVLIEKMYDGISSIEVFLRKIFREVARYGRILNVYVCDGSIIHLSGNVYLEFETFEAARNALERIAMFHYGDRVAIRARFTTMDRRGICRFYLAAGCSHGRRCAYLHTYEIPRRLIATLQARYGG